MNTVRDMELAIGTLQQAIRRPYNKTGFPGQLSHQGRFLAGKKEVSLLRALRRRLFNQAKRMRDRESYKTSVTCYNKKIIMAKHSLHEGLLSGHRGCSWKVYS